MQAGGQSLAYAYDALGRVTSETSSVLTKSYAYRTVNGRTCDLVSTLSYTKANGTSLLSLSYTYDAAGNIQIVSKSGTVYDQYAYDELGQLIREDNKDANKSYTYTYDSRGNILEKKTYAFTLGTLGTVQSTASYGYATDSWKDRLTSYNGSTITYDAIGNPLTYNNGSAYTFTWEGRQMQTATKGNTTWTYTYNADGLRTGKSNGTTTYTYTWNENRQLSSMTWNTGYALFYYDANGTPNSVVIDDGYDVQTYCYVTNLQGDIVGLISAESGDWAVTYEYDAWGNLLDKKGYSSGYAGAYVYNPLTYKGYLYDEETGFYYLQSRYYDPKVGRFLNSDDPMFWGANGNILSCSLFTYCNSNPINMADITGNIATNVIGAIIGGVIGAVGGAFLGKWLADRLGITGFWARVAFIGAVSLLVGATAAAIGYFIGPYVAKVWSVWSAKLSGLIKGTFKSIAKITSEKMSHINVSKHLWNKVMEKVTTTQIETLIHQGIRKGTWNLLSNGSVKILYKYGGQIIVITGKVVNNIFRIGDAWVWNGIGTP